MSQPQRYQLEQFRQPQQQQQKWNTPTDEKIKLRTPAEKEKELREMLQKKKQDLKDKEAERDRMLLRISENTAKTSSADILNTQKAVDVQGKEGNVVHNVITDILVVDDDAEGDAEDGDDDDWLADPQADEEEDDDDNSLNVSNTSDGRPSIAFSLPFAPSSSSSSSQPTVPRPLPLPLPAVEEESFNSRGTSYRIGLIRKEIICVYHALRSVSR